MHVAQKFTYEKSFSLDTLINPIEHLVHVNSKNKRNRKRENSKKNKKKRNQKKKRNKTK